VQYFYTVLAFLGSFSVCSLFTHPKSKIWKHYPKLKIKRLELLPSVRITIKGRVIHLHHWMNLSIILVITIFMGVMDSWVTRGVLIGGIVQGLTTPSPTARKIIYKKTIDVQL
jgi:hypothetical protein